MIEDEALAYARASDTPTQKPHCSEEQRGPWGDR